jgi:hypothetical protein
MMIAALALAAAIGAPSPSIAIQQATGPVPDRTGIWWCGFTPGGKQLLPVPYGAFFSNDDASFVDRNGYAYFTREGWTDISKTPFTGAEGRDWFRNNEPLVVNGATYAKYGLPRILGPNEVAYLTEHDEVGVFAEPDSGDTPEVIYAMVAPDCSFQPYQRR